MNDTWSHDAARVLVRPLVGTWVRPNHITMRRLLTGILACVLLALGEPRAALWSGVFWLISVFLDRADGELARIGQLQSRGGDLFDYYTDTLLNSGFFLAAGIGLTHTWLGSRAIPLGIATCVAMLVCEWLSELYEALTPPDVRVWEGCFGLSPRRCAVPAGAVDLAWLARTGLGGGLLRNQRDGSGNPGPIPSLEAAAHAAGPGPGACLSIRPGS